MRNNITERQRYQIEILLQEKYTCSQIADLLGHKYHTVYQEIKRGTVKQLDYQLRELEVYRADYAQMVRDQSCSNRGRSLKIGSDLKLVRFIEDMIKNKKYSPEAVTYYIRNNDLAFDTDICTKTIYNYIDQNLFLNLSREDLPLHRKKKKRNTDRSTVSLTNRFGRSIEDRDVSIQDRNVYGHWEMDTVVSGQGTGKSCLLVLSERMTREEIIVKLDNKKSVSVVAALNKIEKLLGTNNFREKIKTITTDNGCEFFDQEAIETCCRSSRKRTTMYYCHPYSSYERGTNENINRMIRRFFPKGTNFDLVTPDQVAYVQHWINNYPRKILGGLSTVEYKKRLNIA